MRWFFTLVRLYIEATSPTLAAALCKRLSNRVANALVEVGSPKVKNIFEATHGSITGAQYRLVTLFRIVRAIVHA